MKKEPLKKLLIVEDEISLSSAYEYILKDYDLRFTTNAKDGWEVYKKWKPDLVLLDLYLPGGETGNELLEKIRKKDKETKVIILTNLELKDNFEGISDYLIKAHVTPHQIRKAVDDALKT